MILAGDVGGTKTRLALYDPADAPRAPRLERRLESRAYPSLEALIRDFLPAATAPSRAVLGVAGPVVEQRVVATSLPWPIEAPALSAALGGTRVVLLNDLEATAWGLPLLRGEEIAWLQPGAPARGNRALIAAGTGLGEAILVADGAAWRPTASEGGHADFAPRDALEDELLRWLRERHGRVSYERILSGPGLADLYRFLAATGRGTASPEVAARFAQAEDPGAIVSAAALDGSCARARLALERFVSIYGAEAGNLALKALAVGGVYLGGGIAPRILPVLGSGAFLAAFAAKGRLSAMLAGVPVAVVRDDHAALWGAAHVAGTLA
jgi:glucokinase